MSGAGFSSGDRGMSGGFGSSSGNRGGFGSSSGDRGMSGAEKPVSKQPSDEFDTQFDKLFGRG